MAADRKDNPIVCSNCGWQVDRFYCPNCGQHVGNHNSRLWPLIQEFLEEFVRFDSKLLRTIGPLIRRPGFLTREWAEGKRVRYITPLKLYVTLSAVFFLVLSIVGNPAIGASNVGNLESRGHVVVSKTSILGFNVPHITQLDPKSFVEHFFMHLPAASLLLIPFTALILWVLYVKRKVNYVEHLVFVLHYNSFCFLTLGLALLTRIELAMLVAFFWALGYLPFAMKANYRQGWFKTFLKCFLFIVCYIPLLGLGFAGTAVVSATMASKLNLPIQSTPGSDHMH